MTARTSKEDGEKSYQNKTKQKTENTVNVYSMQMTSEGKKKKKIQVVVSG